MNQQLWCWTEQVLQIVRDRVAMSRSKKLRRYSALQVLPQALVLIDLGQVVEMMVDYDALCLTATLTREQNPFGQKSACRSKLLNCDRARNADSRRKQWTQHASGRVRERT